MPVTELTRPIPTRPDPTSAPPRRSGPPDVVAADPPPLAPGTPVEVRTQFQRDWATGFEVVEGVEQGYRVRRVSDGRELPTRFPRSEVRRQRRRGGQWWY